MFNFIPTWKQFDTKIMLDKVVLFTRKRKSMTIACHLLMPSLFWFPIIAVNHGILVILHKFTINYLNLEDYEFFSKYYNFNLILKYN